MAVAIAAGLRVEEIRNLILDTKFNIFRQIITKRVFHFSYVFEHIHIHTHETQKVCVLHAFYHAYRMFNGM